MHVIIADIKDEIDFVKGIKQKLNIYMQINEEGYKCVKDGNLYSVMYDEGDYHVKAEFTIEDLYKYLKSNGCQVPGISNGIQKYIMNKIFDCFADFIPMDI